MNSQSHKPSDAGAVHSAYSTRALEYIDLLGNINTTAPQDRAMVALWAPGCADS